MHAASCSARARRPVITAGSHRRRAALDKDAEKWVQSTLRKMSVEEKVGQMLVSSFQTELHEHGLGRVRRAGQSRFTSTRSAASTCSAARSRFRRVLLNPTYGAVTLGQPLEAASILNRLQAISPVPLLNTADFEAGVGFRIAGATAFPRLMAFGAARDERLARGSRTRHR